ncbi:MmcQ/YjbR family DNA-binding protein [Williamsia sp. 1135]|uniref:MmcQ/YjbR family DNA-binding protein n=1 Tax=Williamsia sp. 1135 TaxID=1889262 RepID=UPI000A1121A2|nr:MmcQ/YjbR family DNA-binding protein [Williamsia sp. 1135]ORM33177.1 hypothetical protein BFL43_14635 [Williamsia sp. 1135]
MARSRRARPADIEDIALSLPGAELVPGEYPQFQVRKKTFTCHRSPRPDAVDPATGERLTDVLLFWVPDEEDKVALVSGDGPFFTTPHFNGYNAVLLRLVHLGQLTRDELEEVIVDAWHCRAPATLRREWEQQSPR